MAQNVCARPDPSSNYRNDDEEEDDTNVEALANLLTVVYGEARRQNASALNSHSITLLLSSNYVATTSSTEAVLSKAVVSAVQ